MGIDHVHVVFITHVHFVYYKRSLCVLITHVQCGTSGNVIDDTLCVHMIVTMVTMIGIGERYLLLPLIHIIK